MHMWAQLFLNRIDLHKGKHLFGLASKAVPKFGEKRSLSCWCHWCLRVFEDLIEDFLHSDNLTYLTHVLKVYFFSLLLIAGESRLRRLVRAAWVRAVHWRPRLCTWLLSRYFLCPFGSKISAGHSKAGAKGRMWVISFTLPNICISANIHSPARKSVIVFIPTCSLIGQSSRLVLHCERIRN